MTQEVPLASLNSTFHHVCTLVKHSVCSPLFLHIILWGCSVSGVLWSPLFPLHAFLFHPARKLEGFLLCPTFDCKTNAHERCLVLRFLFVCFFFLTRTVAISALAVYVFQRSSRDLHLSCFTCLYQVVRW